MDTPFSGPEAPPFASLQPWDEHNQRLRAAVRPDGWSHPTPASRYNLVVLGGGPAGLVAAAGAAGLGAKVALVEEALLGGDCLNAGCVPSKALIRSARAVAGVRGAGAFGVRVEGGVRVDFGAVMARMRRLRAELAPHDSAARFRALGVDVFLGAGRFVGPDAVEVEGRRLRFARAVIATGARAVAPEIPGLGGVPWLTHETLFSLTELPARLAIVGAGPQGCEMAQAFARFGAEVFLTESASGILPREDRDAARVVGEALARDGVRVLADGRNLRVSMASGGVRLAVSEGGGTERELVVDRLLVAVGRAPRVEGLGLEAAGVPYDRDGVQVDDHLRTGNPRIYACGDVCPGPRFTHLADFQARMVIRNALFGGRARASELLVPRCTYTSPEVAQVGWVGSEAGERGVATDTFTQPFGEIDRAVLDGETEGFVRVHVRRGTDRIVGATVVGEHAGDLISELTLAMRGRVGLGTLGATMHPYPTQAEAIRRIGDRYQRTRLKPWLGRVFARWFAWRRA